jgi:hypothetical protein
LPRWSRSIHSLPSCVITVSSGYRFDSELILYPSIHVGEMEMSRMFRLVVGVSKSNRGWSLYKRQGVVRFFSAAQLSGPFSSTSSSSSSAVEGITTIKVNSAGKVVDPDDDETEAGGLSNRQKFRNTPVDMKVLAHLDELNLGYLPTRKEKLAITKRRANLTPESHKSVPAKSEEPYPFSARVEPVAQAKSLEEIPMFANDPPEVALIGRSNVGKSTLINALLGYDSSFTQKAGVSPKPGYTRALHVFGVGMKNRSLNDDGSTPKYGYIVLLLT